MRKVIAMDLDGTLCESRKDKSNPMSPTDCLSAIPITDNIKRNNELFEFNFIIIYTARRDNLISATFQWLRDNGVRFDALSNNKMNADSYIDDKCQK